MLMVYVRRVSLKDALSVAEEEINEMKPTIHRQLGTAVLVLMLLLIAAPAYADHMAMVTDNVRPFGWCSWLYVYDVMNAGASTDEINRFRVTKTNGVSVKSIEKPVGWVYTDGAGEFRWVSSVFGDDIDPGDTKTFKAVSTRGPVSGNAFTRDDGTPPVEQMHTVQRPDTTQKTRSTTTNTSNGHGTFNPSTGLFDYGLTLTALDDNVMETVFLFDPVVDLLNIQISDPNRRLLQIGFDPDDLGLPGDRSDPSLRGLALLYTLGPGLEPDEFVTLTLSSHFAMGSVDLLSAGAPVWGPTAVPEPCTLVLLGTGFAGLLGYALRQRKPSAGFARNPSAKSGHRCSLVNHA